MYRTSSGSSSGSARGVGEWCSEIADCSYLKLSSTHCSQLGGGYDGFASAAGPPLESLKVSCVLTRELLEGTWRDLAASWEGVWAAKKYSIRTKLELCQFSSGSAWLSGGSPKRCIQMPIRSLFHTHHGSGRQKLHRPTQINPLHA